MSLVVINLISKSAEHLKLLQEISTGTADTKFLLWRVQGTSKSSVGLGGRRTISTLCYLPRLLSGMRKRETRTNNRPGVISCIFWEIFTGAVTQRDSDPDDGTACFCAHSLEQGDSSSGIHVDNSTTRCWGVWLCLFL